MSQNNFRFASFLLTNDKSYNAAKKMLVCLKSGVFETNALWCLKMVDSRTAPSKYM